MLEIHNKSAKHNAALYDADLRSIVLSACWLGAAFTVSFVCLACYTEPPQSTKQLDTTPIQVTLAAGAPQAFHCKRNSFMLVKDCLQACYGVLLHAGTAASSCHFPVLIRLCCNSHHICEMHKNLLTLLQCYATNSSRRYSRDIDIGEI